MRVQWPQIDLAKIANTIESLRSGFVKPSARALNDIRKILSNGVSVEEHMNAAWIEFDAKHGVEARTPNPLGSIPLGFTPIEALTLSALGGRLTGTKQTIQNQPLLNTTRKDGFLGITVQYASPLEIIGPISRVRSAALALTTGNPANVANAPAGATSITPTPGSWLISGGIGFNTAPTTNVTSLLWGVSKTTGAFPAADTSSVPTAGEIRFGVDQAANVPNGAILYPISAYRADFTVSTPLFLVGQAAFTVAACSVYGFLEALRIAPDPATTARVRGILWGG